MERDRPIGVLDSGLGGLSVLTAIAQALPGERLCYVADHAHLPYGEKPLAKVNDFTQGIVSFLEREGCKLIVIACNTASAASLESVRKRFPYLTVVGMEPAVKPAAEHTHTGVVGVLATTATFQSEVFASVVGRFAHGATVLQRPCPGLVQRIEAGDLTGPGTEAALRAWIQPLLDQHIDALVLGCTHYPFVRPLIERICGPGVRIIDPAPAIARRVQHLLFDMNLLSERSEGQVQAFTSGRGQQLATGAQRLGITLPEVHELRWNMGTLERTAATGLAN
jgi:glutamate racemase